MADVLQVYCNEHYQQNSYWIADADSVRINDRKACAAEELNVLKKTENSTNNQISMKLLSW